MSRGSNRNNRRAITLMELIIALVLLSMIVIGITNIETFCKHAFTGTDRKTKVSNEATYIVEHMSKFIGRAIGHAADFPVTDAPAISGCDNATRVWVDTDASGIKDAGDREIVYCFNNTSHTLDYYPQYRTWPDLVTVNSGHERLSRNTQVYDVAFSTAWNYIELNVTACWNATIPCGSIDNPRVTLQTRISLPSVSVTSP